MDTQSLWDRVYDANAPNQVSWFRPHLQMSLALIERAAPDRSASIIDVGAGTSTLIDDLILAGYRLGQAVGAIRWLCGDVTLENFPRHSYDVWHDRAVFHFLTKPEERRAYVREFGTRFRLVESSKELHQTPFGTSQQFLYCRCTVRNETKR